jgi:uncharacterized protein YbjT (DUF2867 family)
MYIILGGTGHIGGATATALLDARQPVTVVTRSAAHGEPWRRRGAEIAVADVRDVDRLRGVLRQGRRALLVNPPADPATDTDRGERETVRCLLAALEGSGLETVVAPSTYGARPGEACGDLTVLHGLEQGLRRQPIPATVLRVAYLMSNWDGALEAARGNGRLPSMLPADFELPMAAPADVGRAAARLLQDPPGDPGPHYIEGPRRYSPADVAAAFSQALGRDVRVEAAPREAWENAFRAIGFSEAAARSYACMTAATVDDLQLPAQPLRGTTTLEAYVRDLVAGAKVTA